MIDFHNHILPGVDDGAKTMDESIEMLKCAQQQGITDVVNTVHFQHPKLENKNTDFNYISSIKDKLLHEMHKQGININIHLGAEVFFNFNLLEIVNNDLTTFCNNKYMLVEFQTHQFPIGYDKHLFDLAMSGITPIIAHPERYKPIQNNIEIINNLIKSGCIIQIDAGSVLGHFGPNCMKACKEMLRRKMVHVIGSDSHNARKRNFCLIDAVNEINKFIDYSILDLVNKNPGSIINGKPIKVPETLQIKKRFFSSLFFKKK